MTMNQYPPERPAIRPNVLYPHVNYTSVDKTVMRMIKLELILPAKARVYSLQDVLTEIKNFGFEHYFMDENQQRSLMTPYRMVKKELTETGIKLRDEMTMFTYALPIPERRAPNIIHATNVVAFRDQADAVMVRMLWPD